MELGVYLLEKDKNSMADQPADETNIWTPHNFPRAYAMPLISLLETTAQNKEYN